MINNETCSNSDIYDKFDGKGWGEVPSGLPQVRKLVLGESPNGNLKEVLQEEGALRRLVKSFRREGKHVSVLGNGTNEVKVVAAEYPESLGNNPSAWRFNPFKPRKTK